jgi:hypothetical protein
MSTTTSQPTTPVAGRRHHPWARLAAVACVAAVAASAQAQVRRGGRWIVPDRPFETVWVVDRGMAELQVWQALVGATAGDGFRPVVLHLGGDERWTESLNELLRALPDGRVVWVGDAGTPVGLDTDGAVHPAVLAADGSRRGPAVHSADPELDDLAALIAMRLDGELVVEPPAPGAPAVLVGATVPASHDADGRVVLAGRTEAIDYANRLARRPVVLVARRGELLPEHVLWAYQRDAKLLELAEVPPFALDDLASETAATMAVRDRIREALPALVPGGVPEALVIAADRDRIPFRFARSTDERFACSSCDNGFFEYAADAEYGNLDGDPWGEPEVPVGRLTSPVRDLLAIQSVLGLWREHGGFPAATDGVVLGLLGGRSGLRDAMAARWQALLADRQWWAMGPEAPGGGYHLDREAFLAVADRSDLVLVHGHGHPDFLSPDGSPFNQALWGRDLVARQAPQRPAFWFLSACSTGKPDRRDHVDEDTLLVGLQSRLAAGSLMAVEVVGGSSSDLWWLTEAAAPGLTVGELVRRAQAAAIAAYRDHGPVPSGMARPCGNPATDMKNAFPDSIWIGDPLTPLDAPAPGE